MTTMSSSFRPTKKRKGDKMNISTLWVSGLGFVMAAVVLGIGAYLLSNFKTTLGSNDTATNEVFDKGTEGLSTFAKWMPILAFVIVGGMAIGFLITYIAGRK